jgi:hypothetical protein
MDILQQPDAFCFSSALKDIVIQSEVGVQVTFATGGNTFLQETYVPDSENRIYIRGQAKLFPVYIPRTALRSDFVITPTPDGGVPVTVHTAVPYGLAETDIPAAGFLSGRFPTLLPGEKITYVGQKEFLSFCPDGATAVVAAVHRLSGVQETKDLQIGTVGQTVMVDVLPAALFDNPEETGCFVTTAGNRHFTFCVKPELLPEHIRFLSVNSFGVVETFIPAAITTRENKYGYKFGQFSGPYRKYFAEAVKNYTAGTGVSTGYMANWIEDLFPSRDIFLLTGAGAVKETVIKELTVK